MNVVTRDDVRFDTRRADASIAGTVILAVNEPLRSYRHKTGRQGVGVGRHFTVQTPTGEPSDLRYVERIFR